MNRTIRKICGAVIGVCGFCTMATLDSAMKKADMPGKFGKAVKGIGRFTTVYAIYGLFMLLAYKLLDDPYIKSKESSEEKHEEEVDRDYEDGLD